MKNNLSSSSHHAIALLCVRRNKQAVRKNT